MTTLRKVASLTVDGACGAGGEGHRGFADEFVARSGPTLMVIVGVQAVV